MPSLVRRLLAVAASGALLLATGWLLDRLAQWQFTSHLRDEAAHALRLAATGDTPYRWRFRNSDDIVAGRIFGTVAEHFSNGELVVSSSGAAFEIGLPLMRAVDLRRFPQLQVTFDTDAAADLHVVIRDALDAPELVGARSNVEPGANSLHLDLAAPGWSSAAREVGPPRFAAMLRLRITLPAGKQLRLRAVVLNRVTGNQRIDLSQTPRIVDADATGTDGTIIQRVRFKSPLQKVDGDAIARGGNVRAPLLVLLPQQGRVEQQIALRNAIVAQAPGAILIAENALHASFAQARAEAARPPTLGTSGWRWMWLGAYGLILGYCRWRPPRAPRLRALAEIVLVLSVPLWLIVGDRFDGNPDLEQKLLIALSLAYAISLAVPKCWRWNGSARAWLLAAAVVMIAALLGFVVHRPDTALRAIGTGHIARYLGWALLQQYLICVVCTERWRIVTGNAAIAVYLGALGFALMHTPNAALMLATLSGGLCWCTLYLRERALLPLAISHAASALLLLALLPPDILASAEVSARFFQ